MKYVNRILIVAKQIDEKVEEAVDEAAAEIRDIAKDLAPEDTGLLKESIKKYKGKKGQRIVGTIVEYAPHQEFGTSRMKAQSFLTPAMEQGRAIVERKLKEKLKDV